MVDNNDDRPEVSFLSVVDCSTHLDMPSKFQEFLTVTISAKKGHDAGTESNKSKRIKDH
jgi:hypothetical protein